jgi:RES domain-containing protein
MTVPSRVHDRAVLDALEAFDPEAFEGTVWRVTRKGYEGLRGSSAHGRWSPNGEFEVLYTSLEQEGALAEIGYRLSLEPVWPSRLEHEIHTIKTRTDRTLRLANLATLVPLGVDIARYETFEYRETQAIAAAAHFLEFDGLLVPSARAHCNNLVIFLDRLAPNTRLDVVRTEPVDWTDWRRSRRPSRTPAPRASL